MSEYWAYKMFEAIIQSGEFSISQRDLKEDGKICH